MLDLRFEDNFMTAIKRGDNICKIWSESDNFHIYTCKIFKIAIKEAYENIRTMVISLSYRAYIMSF